MQVLERIRGTQEVDEEFNDICEACFEANKVRLDPVACFPGLQVQQASSTAGPGCTKVLEWVSAACLLAYGLPRP